MHSSHAKTTVKPGYHMISEPVTWNPKGSSPGWIFFPNSLCATFLHPACEGRKTVLRQRNDNLVSARVCSCAEPRTVIFVAICGSGAEHLCECSSTSRGWRGGQSPLFSRDEQHTTPRIPVCLWCVVRLIRSPLSPLLSFYHRAHSRPRIAADSLSYFALHFSFLVVRVWRAFVSRLATNSKDFW